MRRLIILTILASLLMAGAVFAESQKPPPPLRQGQPRNFASAKHNTKQDIVTDSNKNDSPPAAIKDKDDSSKKESKPDPCYNPKCTNQLGTAENDPITRYTFWLMVFTGFLVFFNALLWIATTCLARDTKKAADAAQQAAIVADRALAVGERAYVFFDKVTSTGFNPDDMRNLDIKKRGWSSSDLPKTLTYSIENHGKTPALITEIIYKHVFQAQVGPIPLPSPIDITKEVSYKFPAGIAIGANRNHVLECSYPLNSMNSIPDIVAVANGGKALFFMGHITYKDIFKKRHSLGFCVYYAAIDDQFIVIGDEQHNYTRDEDDVPKTI